MLSRASLPMAIVLYQPQIPQNTGNIVRLCSATGQDLYLISPLGFSTSNRMLKRAGLDYWEGVNVHITPSLDELLTQFPNFTFFSSHAKTPYTDIHYHSEHLLIFGSETDGLPKHYHNTYPTHFATIPMLPNNRCLNLANTAAIVAYEAWRQHSFC